MWHRAKATRHGPEEWTSHNPTALVLGVTLCACMGTCFLFLGIPMEVPKSLCAHTSFSEGYPWRFQKKPLYPHKCATCGKEKNFLEFPAKVLCVPSPEPNGWPKSMLLT